MSLKEELTRPYNVIGLIILAALLFVWLSDGRESEYDNANGILTFISMLPNEENEKKCDALNAFFERFEGSYSDLDSRANQLADRLACFEE